MDYRLLAKILSPSAEARLRFVGLLVALSCVLAVALLAYGLYRTGELNAARWQIFTHAATWKFLAIGLWNTVRVSFADLVFSMTLGAVIAMAQPSRHDALKLAGSDYAEVFRAIPTLLMILFCFFGLPLRGVDVTPFWAIVIGSGLYNSAALSNIFKSGVQTIDRGQSEAAYSLGLGEQGRDDGRPLAASSASHAAFHRGPVRGPVQRQFAGLRDRVRGDCIYILMIYLLRRFTGEGSQRIDESAV